MRVVDNPLHSIDYCKEVNPHLFIGVPRIYEKVYSDLVVGLGSKVGWLKLTTLGNIVRKKAKQKIGFTNLKLAITGAAPINPDILHLFHDLGIPIYEGYGMTETLAGLRSDMAELTRLGLFWKAAQVLSLGLLTLMREVTERSNSESTRNGGLLQEP